MISKKMKYALKALIEIANKQEDFIVASHIAAKAHIPIKFLEQILTELRKGRIIHSRKGSTGGYYLVKDPQLINLVDIYRLIDGPIAWIACASLNFYERCTDCPDENSCPIHNALVHIRDENLRVLQNITLMDLATGKFSGLQEI